MNQEGIPLHTPVCIIVTAASDITDLLQFFPILNHTHLAGHSALLHTLVQNTGKTDAVLGLGASVGREHDRDGTGIINLCGNPLVGKDTSHHTFLGRNIRICIIPGNIGIRYRCVGCA